LRAAPDSVNREDSPPRVEPVAARSADLEI
jgi:hypothetical protein